jgi:hypothetical protein
MVLKNGRDACRAIRSEDDQQDVDVCAEFPSLGGLAKGPETTLEGV